MPQFFIEAPTGIGDEAKRRMMKEISAAIDHAYHIPDVRIWLREWSVNNVAQDGRLNAEPMRPLCFLEAPELSNLDAKRKLAERIDAAMTLDTAATSRRSPDDGPGDPALGGGQPGRPGWADPRRRGTSCSPRRPDIGGNGHGLR
jgi:hypothetical protein